jgi:preprotein translocase subunit SecG
MLLNLLLILEIIVSVMLVIVVLLQRSEGGVLGQGGGPSGFMTARGAGDLMTRITWSLGAAFFVLALALTLVAGRQRGASSVLDRLNVDAIDPTTLNQPPQQGGQPPAGTGQPAGQTPQGAPAPLSAPQPTLRNPFLGESPGQAPAHAAPAPAAPPAK